MKYLLPLLALLLSCTKAEPPVNHNIPEVCIHKSELLAPPGYEVSSISHIDFNGSVQDFQFVNDQVGFAMMSKSIGGHVEIFKTTDGGRNWTNMEIGLKKSPKTMVFKDENFGIITVQDVTGCPPPNCLNKCVVLKTVNGGQDWEEVEYEELKGILFHPQYDSQGNLYAILYLEGQSTLLKSVDDGGSWEEFYNSEDLGFALTTFSFKVFGDNIYISTNSQSMIVINSAGELLKTIEIGDRNIWDFEIIDEDNMIVTLSGKVIKSTNGGASWLTIHEEGGRIIGFDSTDKGLMLLNKSYCPTDVIQGNDLIASTTSGGLEWNEAAETFTNLNSYFINSQKIGDGQWLMMIMNELIKIEEI